MRSILSLPLSLVLGASLAGAFAEEEVTVTLDQVPAAVKATILKAAGGAKVEVEKETVNGKVIYLAEWIVKDGKSEVEIAVAEDGTLLQNGDDDEKDKKKVEKKDEKKNGK